MNWHQAKDALIIGLITLISAIFGWWGSNLWAAKEDTMARVNVLETSDKFNTDMLKEVRDDVKEMKQQLNDISRRVR